MSATTAAEVLAAHYGSLWCPTCGPQSATNSDGGWEWDATQHQADMLAAAGLLVTPEHETGDWRRGKAICHAGRETGTCPQAHDAWGRHVSWRGSDEHDAQVAARALTEEAEAAERQAQRQGDADLAMTAVYLRARARARADRIERGEAT